MDDEITCAICQKSLDNVKDVVTLREKGREAINRASTERYDIIQPATVKRYTKHAAAHTATQLTSPEQRNRRVPFHNYQVAAALLIARLKSPSTLKLTVYSVKRKLISRNLKREDKGVCSG